MYAPALTREFYHGRTETLRAAFPEMLDCIKHLSEAKKSKSELKEVVKATCKEFIVRLKRAQNLDACDRHLLGLYRLALENGSGVPDLYQDPMFARTGGNANFLLSTSYFGNFTLCSFCAPMRPDGYGVYYGANEKHLALSVVAFKACPTTDASKLAKAIEAALKELKAILD